MSSGTATLDSYWDLPDPVAATLVNIKGQRRREYLRDVLTGELPEPNSDWTEIVRLPALPSRFRRVAATWDSTWVGGEKLPDYLPGEVEIARIVACNDRLDVISIRARRESRGTLLRREHWVYRMVDEHGGVFKVTPASSVQPLTSGALQALVDSASTDSCPADGRPFLDRLRGDMHPDEGEAFYLVESLQFSGLGDYFADQARNWAARRRRG